MLFSVCPNKSEGKPQNPSCFYCHSKDFLRLHTNYTAGSTIVRPNNFCLQFVDKWAPEAAVRLFGFDLRTKIKHIYSNTQHHPSSNLKSLKILYLNSFLNSVYWRAKMLLKAGVQPWRISAQTKSFTICQTLSQRGSGTGRKDGGWDGRTHHTDSHTLESMFMTPCMSSHVAGLWESRTAALISCVLGVMRGIGPNQRVRTNTERGPVLGRGLDYLVTPNVILLQSF